MENLVVVLGAGASSDFGVPTLNRLFQDPMARRHLQGDDFLAQTLEQVFWGPRGHTLKTSHNCLTVEEILTIVRDYQHEAYGVPALPIDVEQFTRSLYVLIKKAVYDGKRSTARHLNPLLTLARQRFQQVTWASFNWDCIFEASYYYSSADPIYSHMRTNPKVDVALQNYWGWLPSSHLFLKLHGGVNWWYENGQLAYLPFSNRQPDLDDRWREYEEGRAGGQPVILEPSFYKYEDPVYELLRGQWDRLVASLLEADLVAIIGYSLPEADTEARRALTIGFQSNPHVEFIVIDSAGWACDRYRRLFGQSRLRCIQAPFEDVARNIEAIIVPTAERILGPGHLYRNEDGEGKWFWKKRFEDRSKVCLGSTLKEALGNLDEVCDRQ